MVLILTFFYYFIILVHIYRLVSNGTVEERIVQRAQKKLYLDSMVNRGSTAKAEEIDNYIEENEEEGVDPSNLLSALKFGWNACFGESADEEKLKEMSEADIEAIIDRTRGLNNENENTDNKDIKDLKEKEVKIT